MDENELDLDLDNIQVQTDKKLKVKERFSKLSEKVTLSNKEKDDALAKVKTSEEESKSLARERDFYKDFSISGAKYPNAAQYQDKIFDKVKAGYATEDAIVAVLNKEGKLTTQAQPAPVHKTVEGGSATTNVSSGEKSIDEMTRAEKLTALQDAEKRGDISMS